MNNFFLTLSLLSIILLNSCSEEDLSIQKEIATLPTEIESNNTIDANQFYDSKKGYIFTNDDTRVSYLDTERNQLSIPVKTTVVDPIKGISSIEILGEEDEVSIDLSQDVESNIKIKIKIARRDNKGHENWCSNCECGLGFRCGGAVTISPAEEAVLTTDEISTDKIQPAVVSYDESDEVLLVDFINEIDWESFED